MTVDVRRSLVNYLWTLLTDDTALKEDMGGTVRCYLDKAKADAEFPYLVHRLDIRMEEGTFVVQRATYYLDIWSDSNSAEEITAIRERLVQLLDQLVFSTDDVKSVHIEFLSDSDVPTDEQGIWHYAMIWELIFRRDSEATSIEARKKIMKKK